MKNKVLYVLALFCFLSFNSSAKPLCTGCQKKCCHDKTADTKKQPVKAKKVAAATIRPLNFYLFNI